MSSEAVCGRACCKVFRMSTMPGSQLRRTSVPTPALVIDLTRLEQNIATMAASAAKWGVRLRPHAKSHKCVSIARRQIDAGATGVSCATLDEVAAMVGAEIPGILLTSPVAGLLGSKK